MIVPLEAVGIGTNLMIWLVALVVIPSILVLLMPLIDQILSTWAIEQINYAMDQVEYFIGSGNTNLLFATIGIIILMLPIKRFIRLLKN